MSRTTLARLERAAAPVADDDRTSASAATTPRSPDTQLAMAILNELTSSALFAAITGGFLASRVKNGQRIPFDLVLRTVPHDPMVFPATIAVAEDVLGSSLIQTCREYYSYLKAACEVLLHLREATLIGKRITSADARRLTDHWRATCEVAILALEEIETKQKRAPAAERIEQLDLIRSALIGACKGQPPYLDKGTLRLPEWAERRQGKRCIVNARGFATGNGRRAPVMIENVSPRGFGLRQLANVNVGDFVSIELAGRKFVTRVIWKSGNRVGVALRRPLTPLDPLLSA